MCPTARLDPEAAQKLEGQWRDFERFADVRLQRAGRCHESEVYAAFRREVARYRRPEALSDAVLRDMVRNWHPDVMRTRNGYFKNLSVKARVDAFTGEVTGYAAPAAAAPRPQTQQSLQEEDALAALNAGGGAGQSQRETD